VGVALDPTLDRMIPMLRGLLAIALVVALPHPGLAQQGTGDSLAVVHTVRSYHAALVAGDSSAALALLGPDAVILETGGRESRDEYRSHHLPGDIQFARAVPSEQGDIQVTVAGDIAWAVSTSTTSGTFRDRAINSVGAELMVLSRAGSGWLIRAIHWSSRARR